MVFLNRIKWTMQNGSRRSSRPREDKRGSGSKSDRVQATGSRKNLANDAANAKRTYERYMALARAAALTGDPVEMENCYQHAEHYLRLMRGQTA
jgi:uncharacterized MAPEG superfamily protein